MLWLHEKPFGGLLNLRGSLSSSIPAQVIAKANKEVQKVNGVWKVKWSLQAVQLPVKIYSFGLLLTS